MPRLFVAIRPPAPVRERLLDAMGGIEAVRWQRDEQLHLTLAFAGDVGRRQANELTRSLAEVESEEFEAEVAGVGHFERRERPSAVWARVPLTEPLAQLQKRVERACRRADINPPSRAYRPHITLAYLNRSAGLIAPWLAEHGTLRAGPWQVRGFTLYESHLHAEGSIYQAIVDYEF